MTCALPPGWDQFNKAIEVDAGYAPAYSGLADCYTTLGYLSYLDPLDAFPRARDAATKALELEVRITAQLIYAPRDQCMWME